MNIADRAWIKVLEATGGSATRWTSAEALLWINDGIREIVTLQPQAYTLTSKVVPASGTRQTLAALSLTTGTHVTDITANFNSAGTIRGRPITKIDRIHLDELKPGWHAESAAEAIHWMEDSRDPRTFFLWPAVTGGGQVEIVYPAMPTALATLSATIPLGDEYANALQAFTLFSFYSKDSTYTKAAHMAPSAWNLFMQLLGLRGQSLAANSERGDQKAQGV
jgi:hypothetical protein